MDSSKGSLLPIMVCLVLAVGAVAVVYGNRSDSASEGVTPVSVKPAEPAAQAPAAQAPGAATPSPAPSPAPAPAPAEEPGAEELFGGAPANPAQDIETATEPNPDLVVEPVDEMEMPLDAEKGRERFPFYAAMANRAGFVFEREQQVPGSDEKEQVNGVVVPGTILVTQGIVELFGCGEGGKEHETVLRLDCDVQSLDNALTLAGFERGPLPAALDLDAPNQGSRVMALVQWEDKEGKIVTYRSEDLVVSVRRGRPMPRVGWTYVARFQQVDDPTSPGGARKNEVLDAARTRSFVTTFRDSSALLDNPLEEAVDDTLFAANYMLLPQSGTPVRVIFRTPTKAERDAIRSLERKLREEPKTGFTPDDRPQEK